MKLKVFSAVLALALAATAARAADKPTYLPVPDWVKPIAIPKLDPKREEGAAQLLLQDSQSRLTAESDDFFQETAVKVRTAQGLSDWGNVILTWRPDTEDLVIHHIRILRGDQVIDLLNGGKTMTVLRRETNLEMAMLDGSLTATLQPEGLQVGDIIDMAYTRRRHDPVMKGNSEDTTFLARPGLVGKAYFRAFWPKAKAMRWQATDGLGQPRVTQTAAGSELVVDLDNVEAPQPPRGAPRRFDNLARLQVTQFSAWSDISILSAPLYAKAATLTADSPLHAEIARIKAASNDPKARAAAALKLVEDRVRYLFLGLNDGGYVPADADVTWSRRFGDCKAKTVLLLAILKDLGIEAEPALVSTGRGDGMDERLPSMGAFDHVAVSARIGGKAYWLDGTRIGDKDIDALPTPDYHWMLPVRAAGAGLEKLAPPAYAEPHVETVLNLDASAGMDAPAQAHAERRMRGDEGLGVELSMGAMTRVDLDRAMRGYWRKQMPWIEPKAVAFTPDDGHGVVLTMDGVATLNWSKDGDGRNFFLDDSNIGSNASYQREPGPHQDAPYAVGYPTYVRRTVTVILPAKGEGFGLANAQSIDQVVAGVHYTRTARLKDGKVEVESTMRAETPEFPAKEAPAAAATLRDWALYSVAIRTAPNQDRSALLKSCAQGQPDAMIAACDTLIAQVTPRDDVYAIALYDRGGAHAQKEDWDSAIEDYSEAIGANPKFAEAFNSRGAMHQRRRQVDRAISDYSQAIALKGDETLFRLNRGMAYTASGKPDLAVADYDHVIAADPANDKALANRGVAFAAQKDWPRALADFNALIKLKPTESISFAFRAGAYEEKGDLDLALADYDRALALAPKSTGILAGRSGIHEKKAQWDLAVADLDQALALAPGEAGLLNARCWVRAESAKGLDLALADCNAALAKAAGRPDFLDSRGLVYLRLNQLDKALADYEGALRITPKLASSLYGRGLVKSRMGQDAASAADLQAAKALDPKVGDIYVHMGLSPQGQTVASR